MSVSENGNDNTGSGHIFKFVDTQIYTYIHIS